MKIIPNPCSSCGDNFICESKNPDNCWCMKLPTLMPLNTQKDCECPNCLSLSISRKLQLYISENKLNDVLQFAEKYKDRSIHEHIDYNIEKENYVFTEWYHLKRGNCCDNGCRKCPFETKDF